MHFRIDQWRAWAPGQDSKDDWLAWSRAPERLHDTGEQPDVSFLPALQRRRLSRLARMVFQVAWPLAEGHSALPLVFASRHGETPRSLAILQDLAVAEPLSPTQFSLSVHNAIIGQWSILRGDTSEMTALAGEGDGLEMAMLEALTLLADGAPAVLLVIGEEAQPELYAPFIDDVPFPYALALLLVPGDDWNLQLRTGNGPRTPWPHPLSLILGLCNGSATLEHTWKERQWTWSHKKPVRRYSAPYWWRLIATAASFTLFGIGGVMLRVLVFPALSLLPGGAVAHQRRARQVVSWSFRTFVKFMHRSGVLTYEVENAERLGRPGQMIIANHPSLIDVVVTIAFTRNANCVVKQSLWNNPCMRGPIRSAGYISNNGSMDMLDEAASVLQQGQTLVIFPEGTRTTPGCAPEFHRGAAAIALRGARVITPVVISVSPTTLTKAEPWYRIPARRFHIHLRVGEDIDPAQFRAMGAAPVASRKLNDHLHQHFIKELARDERSTA